MALIDCMTSSKPGKLGKLHIIYSAKRKDGSVYDVLGEFRAHDIKEAEALFEAGCKAFPWLIRAQVYSKTPLGYLGKLHATFTRLNP